MVGFSTFISLMGGFTYIITNKHNTTLYTGVTSNLKNRIQEHKEKLYPKSFSARYNLEKLVYYKFYGRIEEAIEFEKFIKGKSRAYKNNLIAQNNPGWVDLFEELE